MAVGDYRLVYGGECPPGESAEVVKSRLRALFKGDPAAFEAAYAALPLTIARGLDRTAAQTHQTALARHGIPCRIESSSAPPSGLAVAERSGNPLEGPGVAWSPATQTAPAPSHPGGTSPWAPGRFSGTLPGLVLRMLTHPRGAIHIALQRASLAVTLWLAALAGVGQGLPRAMSQGMAAEDLPSAVMALVAVAATALLGIGWLYLHGAMLTWTGRWLGGRARGGAIRTVVAWSETPSLLSILLWIPRYLILGPWLFAQPDVLAGQSLPLALAGAGFGIMQAALEVWVLVLLVHALAEVQGFTMARALSNLILSVVLPAVPLALLVVWLV